MNTEKCNACGPKFCEACPDYWVDKTSGDNVVLTKILGAVSEALDKSAAHRVVHIPLIITDQMIEDIIVTAIEGGISYWCQAVNAPKGTPYRGSEGETFSILISRILLKGGSVELDPGEGDPIGILTLGNLVQGIRQYYLDRAGIAYDEDISMDLDADDCDFIIQHALFGELRYC